MKGKAKKSSSNRGRGQRTRKEEFTRKQREIESLDMQDKSSANPHLSKPNDVAWYVTDSLMAKSVASFATGFPLGTTYGTGTPTPLGTTPNAMAFYVVPTFGNMGDGEVAPINIAMRKLYTFVRHENSGSKNYEAPDLMLYCLAMDSVYSYWSFLKRLLGLAKQYTPYNKYYPRSIVMQMGVDFDDLISNIANFRAWVNQYAYKLNSTRVPASMSYMARHMWMYDGIYVDGTSAKAQTYFYTPAGFWKFSPTATSGDVGGLVFVPFVQPNAINGAVYNETSDNSSTWPGFTLHTVADLMTLGDDLFNPIIANEDMNIMSGDILKAYGDGGTVKLGIIDESYSVIPIYSPEVSSQFENIYMAPVQVSNSSKITQATEIGTGYLQNGIQLKLKTGSMPIDMSWSTYLTYVHLVNFHHTDVTPEDVLVATRLLSTYAAVLPSGETKPNVVLVECGSEICVGATVTMLSGTGAILMYGMDTPNFTSSPGTRQAQLWGFTAPFDWCPNVYAVSTTGTGAVSENTFGYHIDIDTYAMISPESLNRMNQSVMLNMFAVR